MPCYYCDEPFVNKDTAVELRVVTMQRQDNGGVLATGDRTTEFAHVGCMKGEEV